MILPEGITGFFKSERNAVRPFVSPASFARACHALPRVESGRVDRFEPAGIARNYHRAIFHVRQTAIAVLCNAQFPLVAFAEANDDRPLRFIEAEGLGPQIQEVMASQILGLALLEADPDEDVLAQLDAVERDQIRYWRPRRIGEIIFNCWD